MAIHWSHWGERLYMVIVEISWTKLLKFEEIYSEDGLEISKNNTQITRPNVKSLLKGKFLHVKWTIFVESLRSTFAIVSYDL